MNHEAPAASPRIAALFPLLLFLVIFLGSGLYYHLQGTDFAFYQIASPVAALPAVLLAVLLSRSRMGDAIEGFLIGAGDKSIIAMCMIYLLAGAFSSVAKATGGVDATVHLALAVIPASFLLPGLFLVAAFISTAMGTSMGTIAAIGPIALGIAETAGIPIALTGGTVVGGAMFGDNLSIISDTTIAATRSQGCEMQDKFKVNMTIAVPAALITLVALTLLSSGTATAPEKEASMVAVIPYLVILVMALSGVNVFTVLTTGVILAGAIGLAITPDYTLAGYAKDIYAGFTGMQEIFLLSLMIGGLGELMTRDGGLLFISQKIRSLIARSSSRKTETMATELGIAASVSITDLCTANNTVAIIVSGKLARDLAEGGGVDPRRSAAILDIFSCVFQGLIPYGAQTLLMASILKISPVLITGKIYYCMLLAITGIGAIVLKKRR